MQTGRGLKDACSGRDTTSKVMENTGRKKEGIAEESDGVTMKTF